MKIKSTATTRELNSSFLKANERFCLEFENYIASKKGNVKGSYNSYSYLIYGNFNSKRDWKTIYQKSTFTSSGNLLLSIKSQTLFTKSIWETSSLNGNHDSFIIRKKNYIDLLRLIFNNKWNIMNSTDNYVFYYKGHDIGIINTLSQSLKSLFDSGVIYNIHCNDKKLIIETRSEELNLEIFDELQKSLN